jgi:Transcriptional Coactivator p15 (PC4)
MAKDDMVAELAKNPLEVIRVAVREFRGHQFVDIRVYYQDEAGSWLPTKKGVTIAPDLWSDFLEALAKVEIPEATPRREARRRP